MLDRDWEFEVSSLRLLQVVVAIVHAAGVLIYYDPSELHVWEARVQCSLILLLYMLLAETL